MDIKQRIQELSLDQKAKLYYMGLVRKGVIDTLPEDPKAAYIRDMMDKEDPKMDPEIRSDFDEPMFENDKSKEDKLKMAQAAYDKAEMDGDIRGQELALAVIDLIKDKPFKGLSKPSRLKEMSSELGYLNENEPTVFDDKSMDELLDIILKYVEDPDDAEAELDRFDDGGFDAMSDMVTANLLRDPEYKAWYNKLHSIKEEDLEEIGMFHDPLGYEPEDMDNPDEDLVIIGSGYLDIKSNFGERPSQTNGEYAELGQKVVDQLHNGDKEAALDFIYSKINENINEEKNCGCGKTPCETYGSIDEVDGMEGGIDLNAVSYEKVTFIYTEQGGRFYGLDVYENKDQPRRSAKLRYDEANEWLKDTLAYIHEGDLIPRRYNSGLEDLDLIVKRLEELGIEASHGDYMDVS